MAKTRLLPAFGVTLLAVLTPLLAAAQAVSKPTVPGVTNFSKLETTIACAGATTPEAVPALKEMGYKSIINLRLATEPGANVEGEAAAAKAAGINYVHIPFNTAQPDPAVADAFVTAVTRPDNNPAFVHCASANRAAAMWMIKRMVVDKWDAEKAGTEAATLGLTNAALKTFAVEYATTHQR
ncbi:MAG TPA: sulfur transferase domain-containing protein [Vicinamibacterales bacterium]